MIDAVELTKDYGTVVAVRDVTFHVGRGEVVGFLGLNGAGKTTTLRMLAGSLGPTSGRVVINGHDLERAPLDARRSLGYMPEATPLYPEMRVGEYLTFRGRLKGYRGTALRRAVAEAAERARVADMERTLIGHLSKGYRQRVGLADALLGRPPLLILDEPTAGLDPNQIHEVRELIRSLGEDHTLLLSTHILSEVEATCHRALVIHHGRLIAQGTLDELRSLRAGRGAEIQIRGTLEAAQAALRALPWVTEIETRAQPDDERHLVLVRFEAGSDAPDRDEALESCVRVLVEAGLGVQGARPQRAALDDVFRSLTAPMTHTKEPASDREAAAPSALEGAP